MLKLSFIIIFFTAVVNFAQSPHGESVDNFECSDCHSTDSWKVIKSEMSFDHSETDFELAGQHINTDCRQCHTTLNFTKVNTQCADCHLDIHENTLGRNCETCHQPQSWLVSNIISVHEQGRFPLLGNHRLADCSQCHISSSNLRFEPLGIKCIDCHREDYLSTQNPNHQASGFSTECSDCHDLTASEWSLSAFAHEFFPLTGGHNISNCFECHSSGSFAGLSNECFSCHETDFNGTQNPSHTALSLSTNCETCHTTNPGWEPALFNNHDSFYQLLGAHAGIRNNCFECQKG